MISRSFVGGVVSRIDGLEKAKGTLVYPSDVYLRDTLFCKCVFAPYPHAKINTIEFSDALKVPGVVRVLTAVDLPGMNYCTYNLDRPVFCNEKTRYEGDVVAVVVAESERCAEEGVKRVKVDFTPLPLLIDPENALDPDAPKVHENGNIIHQVHYESGKPDEIFSRNDVVVINKTFQLQPTDHAFIETEAGIAYPENDGICIITGGQDAYYHQNQVAKSLNLPLEKVHVIESQTGGAFGGKSDVNVQIYIALAAYLTGKPCRMVWSRHEHFISGVKRHSGIIKLQMAASKEGKLLALKAYVVLDTGAYIYKGDVVLNILVECLTGPYSFAHVHIDAFLVYTNNYLCGALRGFGANKACFATEGIVTALANELSIDQIKFRKQNLVKQGELSGIGHKLLAPIHTKYTLDAAYDHPIWKNRHQFRTQEGNIRRGVGMALGLKGYGYGCGDVPDYGKANITLTMDGKIQLSVGAVEMGQGSLTALAALAADTLHCDLNLLKVIAADTKDDSNSGTTAASRTTYAVGRAVVGAAQELKKKIQELAGDIFHVDPSSIQLDGNEVFYNQKERSIPLAAIAHFAEEPITVSSVKRVAYSEVPVIGAAVANPHVLYASNVQVAQVAVDIETGEVKVERVAVFPEVGRVVFRDGLVGQFEGGVAMGLGYALLEKVIVKEGKIQNGDLVTYPVPTAMDMPSIEVNPIEIPEETGPFGAKGIAELAPLPTAPAIINAIEDAIGIRFTTLPVTPEKILEALANK
jgi:CO/xanthine dehydrogenase Mo-binding subunit